jgi:hypothetical protein
VGLVGAWIKNVLGFVISLWFPAMFVVMGLTAHGTPEKIVLFVIAGLVVIAGLTAAPSRPRHEAAQRADEMLRGASFDGTYSAPDVRTPAHSRVRLGPWAAGIGLALVLSVGGYFGLRAVFEGSGDDAASSEPEIDWTRNDLDCPDIGGPVRITGHDRFDLDRDGDGVGCE